MSTPFDINARLVIQSTNIGQVTQQLQTALNKVGAVAGQGAASNLSSKQISNLTKKLGPLGTQFDKARASATKFANSMRVTANQLKSVAATIDQTAQSAAKLNSTMRAASNIKVKVSGVSSGGGGGGNIVAHNKKIADSVRRVTNEYEEFGRQIVITGKRFATYVVAATAFYGVASALRDGIKEAIDFQHQMVRLSQTTGKSLGGLRSIRKEIDDLSTGFGVSSRELSQVSVTLAQAGFTAKETGEALRALGKTTLSPSFESLEKTTEGAIAAMRQFNIETSRLEATLGSINTVAAKFAVESNDIITAIQKAGGTFATLDNGLKPGEQSLREFIGIFSAVRDTTRESADTIATGLRTIFARVQSPKVIDFLKQYDIQLQEAQGDQKLFIGGLESILEISNKLKNLNTRSADFAAIVQQLGGQRQVSKTIPLFTQAEKIKEAVRVANTGQNSLNENAVSAQQSLQVQFNKTRENFLKLIRDLGDTTSFQLLTKTVLNLTNALIKFADVFKEVIPLATAFFASKAIGPLLSGAGARGGSVLTGVFKEAFRPGHGPPYRRNSGGLIPGFGTKDDVPAMLTRGEYVLNNKAVRKIGAKNLDRWNRGETGFSRGGAVASALPSSVDPEFTTREFFGENLHNADLKKLRRMFYGLAKKTGINHKEAFNKTPIFKLSKEDIEDILANNGSGFGDIGGAFYPNEKMIGINPKQAFEQVIKHEFAHGVDLHLGGGKQYASEIPGTTQYHIATALKKWFIEDKDSHGEIQNIGQKRYYERNHEVFAHFAHRQHPDILKNLFFNPNLSQEEVYKQLGLDPITREFTGGVPEKFISDMKGSEETKKKRTRVQKPKKEAPFEQPEGPYGPFLPPGGLPPNPPQSHHIVPPFYGDKTKKLPYYPGPVNYVDPNGNIGRGGQQNPFQTNGGGSPPHGPPPHNGPYGPNLYGPHFDFNRVSAQSGRRVTANQYQKEVLRDLHRTHGLSYAVKNAGMESRSRLIHAVATQFEQRGLSSQQAFAKAADYVDRNKLSDVLVGRNGQGLGFNDNITNGLDTSITNRGRQGLSGASSYYRRRIQPLVRGANNSRFIRGVGAFGNSPAGLAALFGGTALASGALGSVDSNSRQKRTSGAVGDVVTSTLGGAAFGAAGGPWGILAGAITGLAVGLVSVNKKLKEAKVADYIEDYGKALSEATKNLEKGNKVDFSKLGGQDLLQQRHQAGLANHYLYPTEHSYKEGVSNFDKAHGGEILKGTNDYVQKFIEKNGDQVFANSGDTVAEQTEAAFQRFLKTGQNRSLLVGASNFDKEIFGKTKGQFEAAAYARVLAQLNQEVEVNVQKFTDLASVVDSASDSAGKFENKLSSLGDFSSLRSSYTGILGQPGGINVSGFNAAAKSAGGLFGKEGDELADAAITFNKFSRELPNILRSVHESPQTKFAEALGGNKEFQALGSGPFAEKIKEFILAEAHQKENHIGADAQSNPVELTKNLLSKFDDAAKVLDYAAKQFAENQNRFSSGLSEVGSARIAIGNQRDSIPALQLEAARAKAGFSGDNVGFADLAAPFAARQGRLAKGLAGNPAAIAAQISRNTSERSSIAGIADPTKQQIERFHELGTASAQLRQALEDLADTSKSNAAAQERLAQIEAERSDRLGFAKAAFTADAGEQGKLIQGLHLARFAVGGGNVNRLSAEQRGRVVSTLEGFSNTSNLFGSGKNGQQLLEGLLEKFGGKLPQNLEGERQKQQQTILENINQAIEAQKQAIGLAENETSTKLDLIRQTFDEFVQKLRELSPVAGKVEGFAGGGSIFSPRGTDTVPAMLTPGEFVMRREAVDRIGVGQLQAMNNGFARGGVVYRANGGEIKFVPKKDRQGPGFTPEESLMSDQAYREYIDRKNQQRSSVASFDFDARRRQLKEQNKPTFIGPDRNELDQQRVDARINKVLFPKLDTKAEGKKFYDLYNNQLSRNGRKYREFQAAKKEFRKYRNDVANYSKSDRVGVGVEATILSRRDNGDNFSTIPFSQFKEPYEGKSRREIAMRYAEHKRSIANIRKALVQFQDVPRRLSEAKFQPAAEPHPINPIAAERVRANRERRESREGTARDNAQKIVQARQAAREQKSSENAEKITKRIAELKTIEENKTRNSSGIAHFASGGVVGGAPSTPDHSQLTQLAKAINELSNSPLVEALKNFPHEILLNASHKVEVVFNGAEILQKLMPEIQQIAVDEAKKALRKMLRDKFPEAGTNV